jgi:hypothetical protein
VVENVQLGSTLGFLLHVTVFLIGEFFYVVNNVPTCMRDAARHAAWGVHATHAAPCKDQHPEIHTSAILLHPGTAFPTDVLATNTIVDTNNG